MSNAEIVLTIFLIAMFSLGWLFSFLDRRRNAAWQDYQRRLKIRKDEVERSARRNL